jgi:hypothetical protein
MKKALASVLLVGLVSGMLGGCGYAGVSASGDKVVVLRNDAFLFGILRKAFVCKVTDAGVTSCNSNENP